LLVLITSLIITTEKKVGKDDEKYPKATQQARQEGEKCNN
jgi:hypothetical protein